MPKSHLIDFESDLSTKVTEPLLKRPRRYKVILLNDDYTPMDFVVMVLKQFFQMDEIKATQTMWEIHTKGSAVCGVYTRDIAETKVLHLNLFSRMHEHPLLCQMEPE